MMEGYKGIENDECDAPNVPGATATTATPGGQELELWGPAGEITHQIRVESEGNQLAGVLRAISGNVTKRLKSRVITRAGKSAVAAMRASSREGKDARVEKKGYERCGARATYNPTDA